LEGRNGVVQGMKLGINTEMVVWGDAPFIFQFLKGGNYVCSIQI